MRKYLVFIITMVLFVQHGKSQTAGTWNTSGNYFIFNQQPQPFFGTISKTPLRFKVHGLQRMIISPYNGFVGIGVNDPQNPLQVHANDKRPSYANYECELNPEPEMEDGDIEPNICDRTGGGKNSSNGLGTARGEGDDEDDEDLASYSAIQVTNCVTGREVNKGVLLSMENHRAYLRQLESDNFNISMKGTDVITVTPSLNVGIGKIPNAKLDVNGNAFFKTTVEIGAPAISPNAVLHAYKAQLPVFSLANDGAQFQIGVVSNPWEMARESEPYDVVFRKLGAGHHNLIFFMTNNDNDGSSAIKFGDMANGLFVKILNDRTMRIDGEFIAQAITVKTNVWSDFVFDADYKLMPLYELEQFITTNKHLPEIPSAKEVEENGINVAGIQAKLLQKIEELTLHIIDLQKQIDELKQTEKGGE